MVLQETFRSGKTPFVQTVRNATLTWLRERKQRQEAAGEPFIRSISNNTIAFYVIIMTDESVRFASMITGNTGPVGLSCFPLAGDAMHNPEFFVFTIATRNPCLKTNPIYRMAIVIQFRLKNIVYQAIYVDIYSFAQKFPMLLLVRMLHSDGEWNITFVFK